MSLIRWESFTAVDDMFNRFPSFFGRWSRYAVNGDVNVNWADSVDAAAIRAESKDGVLTIHVPKPKVETKKPATIKVR
jgi:hypothetical protein